MHRLYLFLTLLLPLAACHNNSATEPVPVATGPQKIIALGRVEPETKITAIGNSE